MNTPKQPCVTLYVEHVTGNECRTTIRFEGMLLRTLTFMTHDHTAWLAGERVRAVTVAQALDVEAYEITDATDMVKLVPVKVPA